MSIVEDNVSLEYIPSSEGGSPPLSETAQQKAADILFIGSETEASSDDPETDRSRNISGDGYGEGGDEIQSDQRRNRHKTHQLPRWKRWTKDEQSLYSSLLQRRASDLSLHLYNTHALKRRRRHKPVNSTHAAAAAPSWAAKESWISTRAGLDSNGKEDSHRGYPDKLWTAWPLPSEIVPREGEKVGWDKDSKDDDGDDGWTFKLEDTFRPSRILEEMMMATVLKKAKERFMARKYGSVSMGAPSSPSSSSTKDDMAHNDDEIDGTSGDSTSKQSKFLEAVVMADDEQAEKILRPTVRHTLSKLDNVLRSLHHVRHVYLTSNNDRFKLKREVEKKSKRAKSNSISNGLETVTAPLAEWKFNNSAAEKETAEEHSLLSSTALNDDGNSTSVSAIGLPRAELKRKMGRPRKYGEPRTGESYWAMRRRILKTEAAAARQHTKDEQDSSSVKNSGEDVDQRVLTTDVSNSMSLTRNRPARFPLPTNLTESQALRHRALGLRDWSDVVGIASLTGWDEQVVRRTTKRCEKLFGEAMRFRTLDERQTRYPRHSSHRAMTAAEAERDVARYNPELIPSLETSEAENVNHEDARPGSLPFLRRQTVGMMHKSNDDLPSRRRTTKRFLCPYPSCQRHVKKLYFLKSWNLKRHLRRAHEVVRELAMDEINTCVVVSDSDEEEMYGCVHTDGYLKPIASTSRRRTATKEKKTTDEVVDGEMEPYLAEPKEESSGVGDSGGGDDGEEDGEEIS